MHLARKLPTTVGQDQLLGYCLGLPQKDGRWVDEQGTHCQSLGHLDLSRVGLHRGQAMMIVELVWQGLFGNGPVLAGATV